MSWGVNSELSKAHSHLSLSLCLLLVDWDAELSALLHAMPVCSLFRCSQANPLNLQTSSQLKAYPINCLGHNNRAVTMARTKRAGSSILLTFSVA